MGIRVIKFPDLKKLNELAREKRKRVLEREMLFALTQIRADTTAGRDVDGRTFEPYSPEYADFRKKKGRQSFPPDLTFTGNMLKSIFMTVTVFPTQIIGRLFFPSDTEASKARANNKRREFFALSLDRVQKIVRALNGR